MEIRAVACAVLLICNVGASLGDETLSWAVDQVGFNCLIANLDRYIDEAPNDPVVIVLTACPEVDPLIAMQSISRNSALPSIATHDDVTISQDGNVIGGVAQLTDVVVFSKQELTCIGSNPIPNALDGFFILSRSPCDES